MILNIETSTKNCSVALSRDGVVLAWRESEEGNDHAAKTAVFVEEVLSEAGRKAEELDAVAVGKGPGSYTGLRIGVSTAKGVCYGRGVRLIAIPTLKVMSVPVLLYHDELPDDALLCPMIDARRMEVYSAIFDRSLSVVRETSADVIDSSSYAEFLDRHPVYFFGNGAAKCREALTHPNARFIDGIYPSARNMLPLAEQAMAREKFVDVAYFEPFYLKSFVASRPKDLLHETRKD